MHPCGFDVVDDAPAVRVVADVGQEVDVAAEPAESDGDVERTAADMFVAADDIDQRLADHQPARHCSNASSVARAPLRCNESSAQVYAWTKRGWWARSPNTAAISMNAVGFSCCDRAIGISESASWSTHLVWLAPFVDALGVAGPARHRRRRQPNRPVAGQVVADDREQPFRNAIRRKGAQPRHGVAHARVGEPLDQRAAVLVQVDPGHRRQRRDGLGFEIGEQEFGEQRIARRLVDELESAQMGEVARH